MGGERGVGSGGAPRGTFIVLLAERCDLYGQSINPVGVVGDSIWAAELSGLLWCWKLGLQWCYCYCLPSHHPSPCLFFFFFSSVSLLGTVHLLVQWCWLFWGGCVGLERAVLLCRLQASLLELQHLLENLCFLLTLQTLNY